MRVESKILWKELGDIPVNQNDEIEERFLHFQIGTDRQEIWHWFEDEFNLSIMEDLIKEQKIDSLVVQFSENINYIADGEVYYTVLKCYEDKLTNMEDWKFNQLYADNIGE